MFTIEEIDDFKSFTEKLLNSHFDNVATKAFFEHMKLEISLNHDANMLYSEIVKFLTISLSEDSKNLLSSFVKGTVIFNYKSEIGKIINQK